MAKTPEVTEFSAKICHSDHESAIHLHVLRQLRDLGE
jgi:hypothetical protein